MVESLHRDSNSETRGVRNGTPAEFGYQFQEHAGIVLMLRHMVDADSVRVEGSVEDIELYLKDGRKIFAQAKAPMNPEDTDNANKDLKDALKTLTRASRQKDVCQLIFVTNRINPFVDFRTIRKFSLPYVEKDFQELPDSCKEKIIRYCKEDGLDLEVDKLKTIVIEFDGREINRYGAIRQQIVEFLTSLQSNCQGYADKALERWSNVFRRNAAERERYKCIGKKDMVWPIIVWVCKDTRWAGASLYDVSERNAIEEQYSTIISENTERYELCSKVMTQYDKFRREHRETAMVNPSATFAEKTYSTFMNEFDMAMLPDCLANEVVKLILRRIVDNHITIWRIKNAVGL